MDILALRPVPAAGVFFTLTRRCPLSCAHCSTNSMFDSEEHPEDIFLRLAGTFTPDNRPELIALTGGEPLVRPALVRELTRRAHAAGTRVCLISGMFFARQQRVPPAIQRVLAEIDHFTASLDVFHEQQVSRAAVFRVLHELVNRGQQVSLQLTGLNEEDPYLAEVIADVERTFGDRVPALVSVIGAVGRARAWVKLEERRPRPAIAPTPCALAAWPVVGFDGTVSVCCNQTVVDGPPPPHLRLGHAAVDDWATIRARCLTSPVVRGIRVFGPEYLVDQYGSGKVACDGYCSTCHKLSDDPEIALRLEPVVNRPAMRLIEGQVAALQQEGLAARYGVPAYAHVAALGHEEAAT